MHLMLYKETRTLQEQWCLYIYVYCCCVILDIAFSFPHYLSDQHYLFYRFATLFIIIVRLLIYWYDFIISYLALTFGWFLFTHFSEVCFTRVFMIWDI